jgi:phospho-N-acetylmuramoyl-pentapeptide-transferase
MLYHLFEILEKEYHLPGAGLFQYITFRAGIAVILSLFISLIIGKRIITWLQSLMISDEQRQLGLSGEKLKAGTPTMGGIIIILATIIPVLLLARLDNIYILLLLLCTTWLAIIGFMDDYIKVFRKNKDGLKAKFKLAGQVGLGLIIGLVMFKSKEVVVRISPEMAKENGYEVIKTVMVKDEVTGQFFDYVHAKAPITSVPFLKNNEMDYSRIVWFVKDKSSSLVWFVFVIMTILVVTAVSNGANLTDGLDGLATGVSAIVIFTLALLAYFSGNSVAAKYLNIMYIPNSGEIVIFAGCLLGACAGFLWYNAFPAKVFMGDTGSLMLGGLVATMAILLRKELLIPVLCGIYLVENLSVIVQVWYFKYTKKKYGEGRRVLKMAPLHHHYQKEGQHEVTIVVRFWIVQIILAVVTLITLKIR